MVHTEDHLSQDRDLFAGTLGMVDFGDSLSMTDQEDMGRMTGIAINHIPRKSFSSSELSKIYQMSLWEL